MFWYLNVNKKCSVLSIWLQPHSWTFTILTFHTWSNPSFYFAALCDGQHNVDGSCPSLSWLTAFTLFLNNPSYSFHIYIFFSLFLKVLAGMNVHPAEFDGLKQEYNVKGYPTFCYFEWVESSHPSHFRLSLHFQGSEHQSQATSNKKFCPGLLSSKRPDGDRFTPCNGSLQGLELASTRCKVSDKLWDLLVFPLKKVNSQESRLSVQLGVGVGTVWVAMK